MPFGEYIDFINQITKHHTTTPIIHYSMLKLFSWLHVNIRMACGVYSMYMCAEWSKSKTQIQSLSLSLSHFSPLFSSKYWHVFLSSSLCVELIKSSERICKFEIDFVEAPHTGYLSMLYRDVEWFVFSFHHFQHFNIAQSRAFRFGKFNSMNYAKKARATLVLRSSIFWTELFRISICEFNA